MTTEYYIDKYIENSSKEEINFCKKSKGDTARWVILISLLILIFSFSTYIFINYGKNGIYNFVTLNRYDHKTDFVYSMDTSLQDDDFLAKTKKEFIENNASFLEANLADMTIKYYENGLVKLDFPISHKGREGSWWETPAGLYKINLKTKNHFSSFGNVNMPYSLQFQGNFFIHGPTSYPDGTLTSSDFSGGCIRVDIDNMKKIFDEVKVGTPVIIFETESATDYYSSVNYEPKIDISENTSYMIADLQNDFVFASNDTSEIRSIASITKLMTALIAVEYINVEKEVYINDSMIIKTSFPRLKAGQSIKILDLLSILLMESSNEAAVAIASPIGLENFLSFMNQKADAIGMNNTSFADTSGIQAGNTSTVTDLFYLLKYLLNNRSFILNMTFGNEKRLAYGSNNYTDIKNFNEIQGLDLMAGKTGLSTAAGDCMVAILELDFNSQKRPIAVIVIGSTDAKKDIQKLVSYVQKNYAISN